MRAQLAYSPGITGQEGDVAASKEWAANRVLCRRTFPSWLANLLTAFCSWGGGEIRESWAQHQASDVSTQGLTLFDVWRKADLVSPALNEVDLLNSATCAGRCRLTRNRCQAGKVGTYRGRLCSTSSLLAWSTSCTSGGYQKPADVCEGSMAAQRRASQHVLYRTEATSDRF